MYNKRLSDTFNAQSVGNVDLENFEIFRTKMKILSNFRSVMPL